MALLWGTLLLASHTCVFARDARELQSTAAQQIDMAAISNTLANATAQTLANLSALQLENLADNSIAIPSEKSPFTSLLFYLQPNAELPMQKFGDSKWKGVLLSCALFPGMLFLCGCYCSWCVLWSSRDQHAGKYKPKSGKEKVEKPNGVGQYTCYAVVIILAMVFVAIGSFFNTIVAVNGVMEELTPEIDYINETIGIIQPRIHNAGIWLNGWLKSCAGYDGLKTLPQFAEIEAKNDEYVALLNNQTMTIYNVTKEVEDIPGYIHKANEGVAILMKYSLIVGGVCATPTVILCAGLIWLIYSTIHTDGARIEQSQQKNEHGWLCTLVCVNSCVVLSLAMIAYVAVFFGLFCESPEINTVHLASAFMYGNGTSESTQIVSYYLTGHPPTNVIVESLRKVRNILNIVANNLWLIRPALEAAGLACKDIGYVDPSQLLGDAVPRIDQILPLTKRDRVYYFFDELTNRAMCKNAVDSLTMTLVSQSLIALVLVPWVGSRINKYMHDKAAHKAYKNKEKKEETAKLLELDTEKKKGGYHCTRCRAYFPMLADPEKMEKKEWFTDMEKSVREYKEYSMKMQSGAVEMVCPDCHAKGTLKPGPRKKTYDEQPYDSKCCLQ
jgi:hypothetical protein